MCVHEMTNILWSFLSFTSFFFLTKIVENVDDAFDQVCLCHQLDKSLWQQDQFSTFTKWVNADDVFMWATLHFQVCDWSFPRTWILFASRKFIQGQPTDQSSSRRRLRDHRSEWIVNVASEWPFSKKSLFDCCVKSYSRRWRWHIFVENDCTSKTRFAFEPAKHDFNWECLQRHIGGEVIACDVAVFKSVLDAGLFAGTGAKETTYIRHFYWTFGVQIEEKFGGVFSWLSTFFCKITWKHCPNVVYSIHSDWTVRRGSTWFPKVWNQQWQQDTSGSSQQQEQENYQGGVRQHIKTRTGSPTSIEVNYFFDGLCWRNVKNVIALENMMDL